VPGEYIQNVFRNNWNMSIVSFAQNVHLQSPMELLEYIHLRLGPQNISTVAWANGYIYRLLGDRRISTCTPGIHLLSVYPPPVAASGPLEAPTGPLNRSPVAIQ
jgi:hypothetical protein